MSDPPADPEAVPGEDSPTFDAPWQARAFAVAVAVTDGEGIPWDRFQSRLADAVEADRSGGDGPEEVYYRQWLDALEGLLVEEGVLDPGELADRVAAFEAGDRTAHEFVEGDPRAHADRLPEGHADGGGHDHDHSHGHGHDHSHDHGHDHDH